MNIFSKLSSQRKEENQSDLGKYYSLLAKIDIDNPTAGDAKQLDTLLRALGKSPTDAERDRNTIVEVQQTIQTALANQDTDELCTQTGAALTASLLARQVEFKKLNDAVRLAEQNHSDTFAKQSTFKQARNNLKDVLNRDAVLFAAVVGDDVSELLKI